MQESRVSKSQVEGFSIILPSTYVQEDVNAPNVAYYYWLAIACLPSISRSELQRYGEYPALHFGGDFVWVSQAGTSMGLAWLSMILLAKAAGALSVLKYRKDVYNGELDLCDSEVSFLKSGRLCQDQDLAAPPSYLHCSG